MWNSYILNITLLNLINIYIYIYIYIFTRERDRRKEGNINALKSLKHMIFVRVVSINLIRVIIKKKKLIRVYLFIYF